MGGPDEGTCDEAAECSFVREGKAVKRRKVEVPIDRLADEGEESGGGRREGPPLSVAYGRSLP